MLKGLPLRRTGRFRAFWAAGQSPQQPQPGAGVSAPPTPGSARAAGFPGTPALHHSFSSLLSLPPALPFTSSRDRLSTQRLSVPKNVTYLLPTSRWPRQVLLSFPWPYPLSAQEVKDSPAMAHSQGKSRELNSFSPIPTSLEGDCLQRILPG